VSHGRPSSNYRTSNCWFLTVRCKLHYLPLQCTHFEKNNIKILICDCSILKAAKAEEVTWSGIGKVLPFGTTLRQHGGNEQSRKNKDTQFTANLGSCAT
jgi:hypothetical protein